MLLGCIEIAINYKTTDSTNKAVHSLRKCFTFFYYSVYITFLVVTIIGIVSYLNGLVMVSECIDGDQTCIRTDPLSGINPNKVYNQYPLTFRSDYPTLQSHIFSWAESNGHYADSLQNQTIRVTIVNYYTFFQDVFVQIKECFRNKGFMSVLVQAHLRIGSQDLTPELDDVVKNVYQYLATKYKPSDYSFAMCHSIIY